MRCAITVVLLLGGFLVSSVQAGAREPYINLGNNTGGIGDLKALEVGDIVTVLIQETAAGKTTAETDANTKAETRGGPGIGMLSLVTNWGLETDNRFRGEGRSTRTGTLTARISTRVEEILPSGNYRVKGARIVEINGEKQRIVLSGVIRPEDLKANNMIESTFVADAHIIYDGKGPVDQAQSPGLLTRLVNFLF